MDYYFWYRFQKTQKAIELDTLLPFVFFEKIGKNSEIFTLNHESIFLEYLYYPVLTSSGHIDPSIRRSS